MSKREPRMCPVYQATNSVMIPSPPQPDWMADLLGVPTCCCKVCDTCMCNVSCNPSPLVYNRQNNTKFQ